MQLKKKSIKEASPEKSRKKKAEKGTTGDRLFSLAILAGIIVAVCLFLYPSFVDALSAASQRTMIGSYTDSLSGADAAKLKKAKEQAVAYNEKIRKQQKMRPFVYSGTGSGDSEYQKILNLSGDGVMGYIDIPKIDVSLPIAHGTSSDVLDVGAGHVHGTSVPIGGKGTHSVISAHTGMTSAKLFTDVDKLKVGDTFSIHVLNEVHYYRVTRIRVELPTPANKYLQVDDNKDQVTLYTCTPYGINTHRLLVTAEATKAEKVRKMSAQKIKANDQGLRLRAKAVALAAVPTIILLFGLYRIFWVPKRLAKKKWKTREAKKIASAKHRPPDFSSIASDDRTKRK